MDFRSIETTKNKLTKYLESLEKTTNKENLKLFNFYLKLFWNYITNDNIVSCITKDLEVRTHNIDIFSMIVSLLDDNENHSPTEKDYVSLSYHLLKKSVECKKLDTITRIGANYQGKPGTEDPRASQDEKISCLNTYKIAVIDPLYNYIIEKLDESRVTIAILMKYQQKCQWFHRERLLKLYETNTNIGEKVLKFDMYDYLNDQGWNLVIEPKSPDNEVDLIADQKGQKLVVEAKIFNGNNITKIRGGFKQTYQYTKEYSSTTAYYVVFNVDKQPMTFETNEKFGNIQYIKHNDKIIYLFVIDISAPKTASTGQTSGKTVTASTNQTSGKTTVVSQQYLLKDLDNVSVDGN